MENGTLPWVYEVRYQSQVLQAATLEAAIRLMELQGWPLSRAEIIADFGRGVQHKVPKSLYLELRHEELVLLPPSRLVEPTLDVLAG